MLRIRKATNKDRPAIWRVHTDSVRQVCASHYSPHEIKAWVDDLTPNAYTDVIRTREFIVAEDQGVVVGFGQLHVATGEIEAVYVHPSHIGCGVGWRLIRELETAARAIGLHRLTLAASLNSVRFYERAGYRKTGEGKHAVLSGVEIACIFMAKILSSRDVSDSAGEERLSNA